MAVEIQKVDNRLAAGLVPPDFQVLILPTAPIEERTFRMPRILWVDPFVRIDDNQILALEIVAAGIEGIISGPVRQATRQEKQLSLYNREGCVHIRQASDKTEFWFDIPQNGDLKEAFPLFAGLLSVIDWRGLPVVSGFAGERQYYLNSGRTPMWEFFMSHISKTMLEKVRHTCNPEDLVQFLNMGTRTEAALVNGKVNGALTESAPLV